MISVQEKYKIGKVRGEVISSRVISLMVHLERGERHEGAGAQTQFR